MRLKRIFQIAARYGSVAGVLAFILLVIMYYVGRHPLVVAPYLDFRILLLGIFIFFTLKEFRDYEQGGALYFSQAMLGGLAVVVITSGITALLIVLFGLVEKDFVTDYVVQVTKYLKTFSKADIDRIGKDIYERNLTDLPATNVFELAISYFFKGILIGFFVNIILSVILRRQPKP